MSGTSEAEDAVRRLMKDPDSTQFRDVVRCSADATVSAGEFNAKNLYGAYVGFESFYYAPDTGVVLLSDDGFSLMMNRCYGHDDDSATPSDTERADLEESASLEVERDIEESKLTIVDGKSDHEQIDECWQDYCPCDTSNPDYGGSDVTVCRSIRAGLQLDDQVLAGAAAMRDARRQLRVFDHESAGF